MVMPQMTQFQVRQPPYHKKIEEVKWPVLPEPPVEEEELTLPDVFFKVYPDRKLGNTQDEIDQNIDTFIYDNTEGFVNDLRAKGRTPDTEALLKYLNVPDETINAIFTTGEGGEPVVPIQMVTQVGNVRKMVKIDPDTLVATDLVGRTIGRYDLQTGRLIEQLGPPVSFAQPEKGWLDKVQELVENPAKLIPFVSSGVEIVELSKLMKTALDLEQKKEVSKEDLQALKAYVDRATMNTTWGYEVMDVISQLAPFAGELLLTAGIFSIGKTAVVQAGKAALKKIATKTGLRILEGKLAKYGLEVAGVVAGGTLQTLPAGATRIPADTLEKQLQATLTGDEESVWRSLAKAAGEQWVETVSERTGGLFTPLTSKVKGGLVKLGLFKAFQKANPGKSPDALKKIMERMGYNGVLNEMLEERVGDVMHGVLAELGLSDQKFSIPSLRQLSVELVSFSIPGIASKAVETMPKIAPAVREAFREGRVAPEAGFTRPGAEPRGEGKPEETPAPEVTTINEIKATHVTSNPQPVISALKSGKNLGETRGEGLVGDLGASGLYISQNPQMWVGRATGKWAFLDELKPEQKTKLINKLVKSVDEQMKYGGIADFEYQNLMRDINYVKEGKLGDNVLVVAANQPFNIPFWKPEYLADVGIKQTKLPIEISVTAKGKFADITNVKGGITQELIDSLKAQGYDGMIHRGTWGMPEQSVIWNPKAVEQFGEYKQALPKAEVTPPVTEAGMAPSTSVQTGLPGMEKPAQVKFFEEVSGKEAGKVPLTEVPKRVEVSEQQQRLIAAQEATVTAPEEVKAAYEAQEQVEGIKYNLQTDEVASLRFKIGERAVGKGEKRKVTPRMTSIDQMVDAKEKTFAYNDSFTPAQAKALKPYATFSEANKLPNGRIRADAVLDDLATRYTGGDVNAFIAKVNQIIKDKQTLKEHEATIRQQMTEKPLPAVRELTDAEVTEQWQMMGQPKYNMKQIDALVGPFAEYVMNPNTINAYNLTREALAMQRSERFNSLKAKLSEIQVQEGQITEEQARQIIKDTLSGEYWKVMTDYLQFITGELRDAHFAKVAFKLREYPAEYAGTITALVNALQGRPIPNVRPPAPPGGFKSRLWPQGASALDKLQYVFGKGTRQMKAIEKMAEEKKPLEEVVEGVFHETGRDPIPIDQETAEYLRSLPSWAMQQTVGLDVPGARVRFTYDPSGKLGLNIQGQQIEIGAKSYEAYRASIPVETPAESLRSVFELDMISNEIPADVRATVLSVFDKSGLDDAFDRLGIEMARSPLFVQPTKYPYEAPIDKALKTKPMFNFMEERLLIKVLKEIGWSPVDIGNFLRANMASFDNSFLRQSKVLASGHPVVGYKGHRAAWRSMFSQANADAYWQGITRRPWMQLYEEIRLETGADPLRVPASVRVKGTSRYRRAEEYGFPDVERLIPRITQWLPHVKYSERGFTAGTNEIVAGIYDLKYTEALRRAEKIAVGDIKLKEGESFDIKQELMDTQKFLANTIQRASLGGQKAGELAPIISAFFFAARSKLGRFFAPIHLTGLTRRQGKIVFNPRIMREAWRDWLMMVASITAVEFLGAWLGLWDLDDDPRSGEFMSMRIGKLRIDPWAGYRQFVVLYARLVTQTGISSVTGAEYDVNPVGAMTNFFRSSVSPMAGILLDFWTGRNFLGQAVEVTNMKQWIERSVPFSVQDVWDAFEGEGWKGAAIATIPTIYGEGVQTYTGDWEENHTKLGLRKYVELETPLYDAGDFWSDTASQFKGVDPESLTEKKGYPAYTKAMAEALQAQEITDLLPNKKLISINGDPKLGLTFLDYNKMWKERQKLVDAGDEAVYVANELQPDGKYKKVTYKGDEAVKAYDKDERHRPTQTRLGNLSQTQLALLMDYWAHDDMGKKELLEKHPEMGENPYYEWYKSHPRENAILAVHGKMDVLTEEAYNQAIKFAKEWDYPDSAIEAYLPPKDLAKAHFERMAIVEDRGANSWEDKLFRATNPDWVKWHNEAKPNEALSIIDTPIASLELKTSPAFKKIYDQIQAYGDSTSLDYIADDKARAEAIKKLKTPEYIDDTRRIEAIEKGTDDNPISDALVTSHVEYGRVQDKEGVGSSSAESMLYRVDNPEYDDFRTDTNIWGDGALKPIDQSRIPIWRIDVKYAKEDAEYDSIKDSLPAKQAQLRDEYMQTHPDYRMDSRRREAYALTNSATGETFPRNQVENYVNYYELAAKGFRQERYLLDNPDFAKVMHTVNGMDLPKPEDVPAIEYDDLYDNYKDKFDTLDGLADNTSPYYIEDTEARKQAADALRHNPDGSFTEFGHAEIMRNGYKSLIGSEQYVDEWVEYYTTPVKGYAQERYLKEHQDFYKVMKATLGWTELIKWDWIPSEKVENLWNQYQNLPKGKRREDFRYLHLDLDAWLVTTGKVSKSIEETYRERALTPAERFIEELEKSRKEFEESIK